VKRTQLSGVAVALVIVLSLTAPTPAGADHGDAEIRVSAPVGARIGDTVEVIATLVDPLSGPVAGATVSMAETVEFMDSGSTEVVVSSARTGGDGRAILRYTVRRAGPRELVVRFDGDEHHPPVGGAFTLTIADGGSSYLVEPPPGVPGVNRFLLVALMTGVWGTMLVVALHVVAIARQGHSSSSAGGES
jgi:hypothetical protein